jgi:hypothetical protein
MSRNAMQIDGSLSIPYLLAHYINHHDTNFNVQISESGLVVATRNIKKDEELLVHYNRDQICTECWNSMDKRRGQTFQCSACFSAWLNSNAYKCSMCGLHICVACAEKNIQST